jgi:peptidoglycan glycosyltransferase
MKRVKRRSTAALLIAAALVVGLAAFLLRLYQDGSGWAMYQANRSVYDNGVLDTGTLTDREGVVLASAGGGVYSYADDPAVRKACLHVVGDYGGFIGTGALSAFSDRLAGYSFAFGTTRGPQTVALSVDAQLQVTALNALSGRSGAVLVMDYETGEILCMTSAPTYDPQNPPASFDGTQYEGVFLNRCLSATYTPGSVFKLVTLAAALENLPDLQSRRFTCTGSIEVNGETVTCTGWHGEETIEQALANSCNSVFGELSLELGADTLSRYAAALGITESHTLDGIPTAAGRFDKAEDQTADLAWSGIGQYNDLTSPYAMLRIVAAVAGNGVLTEPTLLEGGSGGQTRLLAADTAEQIGDMMSYNVAYAYGQWMFPGLSVCAKTGTAETGSGASHAWFVGYLDDGPPLAFAVVVEHGGGGLAAAGAVANTVLQKAVTLYP